MQQGDKLYIIENSINGPIPKIYEVKNPFVLKYVGECVECYGLNCEDCIFPVVFIESLICSHIGYPFVFLNNEKAFVDKLKKLLGTMGQ